MERIIICEVAWMKYYGGVTEDDKPKRGGKYIKENGFGGEVWNFAPYNHKVYGYVMHYGDELHLERLGGVEKRDDIADDVTVVWVATDGNSSKISGFYQHAQVHRFWQTKYDNGLDIGSWDYNFVAKEEDAYLIPENKRTFVIPRASRAGKGKGMGQSQVWWCDSEYAREEIVPQILKYLETVKADCIPFFFSQEQLFKVAKDDGKTVDQIIEQANNLLNEGLVLDALELINLVVLKEDSEKTRLLRAECFIQIQCYDEAEKDAEIATLYNPTSIIVLQNNMYTAIMSERFERAVELGEILRNRRKEHAENWNADAKNLFATYMAQHDWEKADELLIECIKENELYNFDFLEDGRIWLNECLGGQAFNL